MLISNLYQPVVHEVIEAPGKVVLQVRISTQDRHFVPCCTNARTTM